jgi:hypothetical protein
MIWLRTKPQVGRQQPPFLRDSPLPNMAPTGSIRDRRYRPLSIERIRLVFSGFAKELQSRHPHCR